jgi:ornithine carbamoyltransferase
VPVLNMQCEVYHPFQTLADLMTIIEKKGRLKGQSITVSWAYAASYQKPISVPQSLILAATRFGMNVKLVHPPEFQLMPDIVAQAEANAARSGGSLEKLDDFDAGFDEADVVYAKSWGAPLLGVSDEEGAKIAKQYTDWISDERRMALTRDDAIWMHPLPADRNVEVADAVIDGPKSAAFDEAENRLHAQKAVMALTMG